jgi:hypothetical protein
MSRTDRRTLRTIARHPEARNLQPIMAILGGQHPWTIAITQTARRPLLPRLTTARIQIYP